jgi:hypothetical protein
MEFDLKDIDRSFAKAGDAAALIKLMVEWFLANYEDPAESKPYDSAEGGYQYWCGGPYSAHEALSDGFQHDLTARFAATSLKKSLASRWRKSSGTSTVEWVRILAPEIVLLYADAAGVPAMSHQFNQKEGRTLCGKPLATCQGTVGSLRSSKDARIKA